MTIFELMQLILVAFQILSFIGGVSWVVNESRHAVKDVVKEVGRLNHSVEQTNIKLDKVIEDHSHLRERVLVLEIETRDDAA